MCDVNRHNPGLIRSSIFHCCYLLIDYRHNILVHYYQGIRPTVGDDDDDNDEEDDNDDDRENQSTKTEPEILLTVLTSSLNSRKPPWGKNCLKFYKVYILLTVIFLSVLAVHPH